MGSVTDSGNGEELTVLVTGFGPFKAEYPVNPSWEIANSLPEFVPPERAKDVAARSLASASASGSLPASPPPRIRIVTPPEPIRVNYNVVRETVPSFWDDPVTGIPKQSFDFVIHIGMAMPQRLYQIERRGHRDHYQLADVDGKLLEDEKRHEEQGDKWIWHGVPHELLTDLNIDDIYQRWVERSPKLENTDLRISENAGFYLCDFIYFSSLAHLWKQERPRKVLFFHVPAFSDDEIVSLGRELCLNLIRSVAESEGHLRQKTGRP